MATAASNSSWDANWLNLCVFSPETARKNVSSLILNSLPLTHTHTHTHTHTLSSHLTACQFLVALLCYHTSVSTTGGLALQNHSWGTAKILCVLTCVCVCGCVCVHVCVLCLFSAYFLSMTRTRWCEDQSGQSDSKPSFKLQKGGMMFSLSWMQSAALTLLWKGFKHAKSKNSFQSRYYPLAASEGKLLSLWPHLPFYFPFK